MKRILLLGDSIRQNYQSYVKENLADVAEVFYPNENGKFGYYTLRYFHVWLGDLLGGGGGTEHDSFDVVHFNVGLWDVLRLKGDTGPFTGEKEYEQVLLRLYKRIRMYCPDAAVIFALTTKVREPGFAPGIHVGERRNSDIIRYNQIAGQLWKDMPVEINDLWSVSEQMNDTARSDDVHFGTEEGRRILGEAVIRCLRRYL